LIIIVLLAVAFACRKRKRSTIGTAQPTQTRPQEMQPTTTSTNEYEVSPLTLASPNTYDVGRLIRPPEERYADPGILAPDPKARGIAFGDTGVGTNYGQL
jgi:hypothetical protein